jgi:hypothetical protein
MQSIQPSSAANFLERPNVVRDARRHRRSDSKRFVNPSELATEQMQRDHVRVIVSLF